MNVNEWTGTEYSAELVEQAANWLGCLDGFVDTNALLGQDPTSEILEQSLQKLNHEKRLAFFEWLGSSPEHQHIFADCCEMWAKTSCLQSLKASLLNSNVVKFANNAKPDLKISALVSEPYSGAQVAPAWAYNVVMGLIVIGMSMPFIV